MDRMDAMDKMDEVTRHASPLKPPPSRRHASPWDRRRPGGKKVLARTPPDNPHGLPDHGQNVDTPQAFGSHLEAMVTVAHE